MMSISKFLISIILMHSCGLIDGSHLWKRTASDEIYSSDRISPFIAKRDTNSVSLDEDVGKQCSERSKITYTSETTAQMDIRFPSVHTDSVSFLRLCYRNSVFLQLFFHTLVPLSTLEMHNTPCPNYKENCHAFSQIAA